MKAPAAGTARVLASLRYSLSHLAALEAVHASFRELGVVTLAMEG